MDLLHVDKRQSFQQVDTTGSGGCGQAFPKYPK